MPVTNLSGQYISASFKYLTQITGSGELYDGLGNQISTISVTSITGSLRGTADNATTASYTISTGTANSAVSASYAVTASFVKQATSASYAVTASFANQATSASYATAKGANTNIQYNLNGSLTGSSYLYTSANGNNLTIGVVTSGTGQYSLAVGTGSNRAEGVGAFAQGDSCVASAPNSHAQGSNAQATGTGSHAEGYGTLASQTGAHAEAYQTKASGFYSHAEGISTLSSGNYSHAEGNYTTASNSYSHAEGSYTYAAGVGSHAEGLYTQATGQGSHAEGSGSVAFADYSHAEGIGTIASGSGQLAVGKFNTQNNTSSLFVVGGGSSDSNRKDVFSARVDSNGSGSIMIPTNTAHPSNPVTGSAYFNPSSSLLYIFNGTWKSASFA